MFVAGKNCSKVFQTCFLLSTVTTVAAVTTVTTVTTFTAVIIVTIDKTVWMSSVIPLYCSNTVADLGKLVCPSSDKRASHSLKGWH